MSETATDLFLAGMDEGGCLGSTDYVVDKPSMLRLLAAAEVGLAVERLPKKSALVHAPDGKWWVSTKRDLTGDHDTPLAAINAALEDTP